MNFIKFLPYKHCKYGIVSLFVYLPQTEKTNKEQRVIKTPSSQQAKSMWAETLHITIPFNSVLLCCARLILLDFPEVTYQVFRPQGPIHHTACFHPFAFKRKSENGHKSLSLQTGVYKYMCRSVNIFVLCIKCAWCCTRWYFAWSTLAQGPSGPSWLSCNATTEPCQISVSWLAWMPQTSMAQYTQIYTRIHCPKSAVLCQRPVLREWRQRISRYKLSCITLAAH